MKKQVFVLVEDQQTGDFIPNSLKKIDKDKFLHLLIKKEFDEDLLKKKKKRTNLLFWLLLIPRAIKFGFKFLAGTHDLRKS